MKKLIFMFLVFSLFCCVGCGDKEEKINDDFIMFSTSVYESGEIQQSVNFSVNTPKIKKISQNNSEYMSFLTNLADNVKVLRDEFLYTFALKYMENPIDENKINSGVSIGSVIYFTESDSFGFVIKYNSFDAWNFYHQSSVTNSETQNNNNLFLQKTESKGKFIFAEQTKEGITLAQKYKSVYIKSASGLSFCDEFVNYHPDFVYSYAVSNKALKSNADIQFTNSNLNFHIWRLNDKNINNEKEVVIWVTKINYGMWYLAALIIVLLPTFTALLIYAIHKKRLGK